MVETRNGAIHVGAAEQSSYVLIDALTLCGSHLEKLDQAPGLLYGEHESNVDGLLQPKPSTDNLREGLVSGLALR